MNIVSNSILLSTRSSSNPRLRLSFKSQQGTCALPYPARGVDLAAEKMLGYGREREKSFRAGFDFDHGAEQGLPTACVFWTLSESRSRLYQRRCLHLRLHLSALLDLYDVFFV